jgi:hypothetical protein
MDDELWTRVVMDLAGAYNRHPLYRGQILRSLTPLYLARVASFVIETEALVAGEVEERIERLCLVFEQSKPYLLSRWEGSEPDAVEAEAAGAGETTRKASLEV